jgi:pantothenate kinase-related protein Tda10
MFRKAERKKAKLRLGILGPSGSGKTYSAILITKGLGGKVALVRRRQECRNSVTP